MEGGQSDPSSPATLTDMFFEISETLCTRYPALDPFRVRHQKSGEVFKILFQILEKTRKEKGIKKGDTIYTDSQGRKHIRRKAQNDDWF